MDDRLPPWAQTYENPSAGRILGMRELATGLISGSLVALLTVVVQAGIDDRREEQADRRENIRFVREQAAAGTAGKGSFRDMDLAGANLSGLELAGADFTGARLTGADLAYANLSEAQLIDADLTRARLTGARLDGASLAAARMVGTHLDGPDLNNDDLAERDLPGGGPADLQYANLSGAYICDTDFTGVTLQFTDFTGAVFSGGRSCSSDSSFDGVQMHSATFDGADVRGVDIPWKEIIRPSLTDTPVRLGGTRICVDEATRWPQGQHPPQDIIAPCPDLQRFRPDLKPLP